jgi:DNA-binding FadR family transcriptional regulator
MIVAPARYRPIRATATRMGGARMGQEQIVRAMGIAILRGDYPEGALLPAEGDLMAQFGISRTVLREVLKTLAAKGLVVSKTRVGTKVRNQVDWNMFDSDLLGWRLDLGMDLRFLNSLYEIRLAVEPAACALALVRQSGQRRHDGALSRALSELRLHPSRNCNRGKPIIGIAQTGSDLSPCNRPSTSCW